MLEYIADSLITVMDPDFMWTGHSLTVISLQL